MYILNNIITNECVDFFRNKIEKDSGFETQI